jgi:16S rRNA C967 or C1407 C5-methylase (RsmB/RsmF family)
VETSLRFLKPETGRLVYATCSILPEENERQVEYFRQIGLVEVTGKQFRSVPRPNEMDGFFATVLQASGSQKGT